VSNSDEIELVLRLLLAMSLGSAIGFEREWRGHEAGIRTLGMVATGAAIFGELSDISGDSRIAAGVVQGIGFLCAGIIFQRQEGPRGLTTAATAWATAGIGLMVSYELGLAAVLATALFIVLLELQPLSDWVLSHSPEVKKAAEDQQRPNDEPTADVDSAEPGS
jgi:putative Mg2+ transporter-C (MgtC) family protein